ncbi:TfoX/Sxy family protein [Actinoplanes sp. GCM10030250]|uniref:TfoX/Sxy family protein n=1 Tax=Actinoplanes sp. GCM10030250 TaxID=3273376 RepID=UPI003606712B
MALDEDLAGRVRELLEPRDGTTSVRMFGGLAWLVHGNMAVVVRGKGGLMIRADPADVDDLLAEEGTAPTIMRGRPMRGWLTVTSEACSTPPVLAAWVERGVGYASSLPPK